MVDSEVTILDYGLGNVGSIQNMLKRCGVAATLASDPESVGRAKRIILPGVGAFDTGMSRLEKCGLIPVISDRVIFGRVPILGICLGMQLMTSRSEEGVRPGLGWVSAVTRRFHFSDVPRDLKIPHMGWNQVTPARATALIPSGNETRFYFVHSYHVCCDRTEDVLATTCYGSEFTSIFQVENITGVQFHPEKSHLFGMSFLTNWVAGTAA